MMAAVMSNGELQNFNREYRRRRVEAAARRLPFSRYNLALAKLRATLAGTKSPSELISAAFDVREIINERGSAILAHCASAPDRRYVRHQRSPVASTTGAVSDRRALAASSAKSGNSSATSVSGSSKLDTVTPRRRMPLAVGKRVRTSSTPA
jgi:hypothetical protein